MAFRRAAILGLAVQAVLAEPGGLRGAAAGADSAGGPELPDGAVWSNASGTEPLLQDLDLANGSVSAAELPGGADWSDGAELLQDLGPSDNASSELGAELLRDWDASDNSSSEPAWPALPVAALGAEAYLGAAAADLGAVGDGASPPQLAVHAGAGWWGHHHHHHHHHHHSRRRRQPVAPPRAGGRVMTLYHETSPAIAARILASGFRPGRSGWCGGAIYFYGRPRVPRSKLGPDSHAGAVIEARVDMGRMARLDRRCHGAGDARRHYDSVTFNPGDGDEYIIFSNSRVLSTRRYK